MLSVRSPEKKTHKLSVFKVMHRFPYNFETIEVRLLPTWELGIADFPSLIREYEDA